jgi:putative PIN family toxin of toxin-antitoxin system
VIRATLDTNVLVSGLVYRRGKPYEVLQRALSGEINLTVSQPILDEMADVLARKFDATPEEVAEAGRIIARAARKVQPSVQLDVIKHDPPDNRILECAVSAGSDYIVTGDKDLLRLSVYNGVQIMNVSDFLEIAAGRSGSCEG